MGRNSSRDAAGLRLYVECILFCGSMAKAAAGPARLIFAGALGRHVTGLFHLREIKTAG